MSNIHKLPNNGHAPNNKEIAKHLREQADWLESDESQEARSAIVITEYRDGIVHRNTCGEKMDRARIIGLLHFSAHLCCDGKVNQDG